MEGRRDNPEGVRREPTSRDGFISAILLAERRSTTTPSSANSLFTAALEFVPFTRTFTCPSLHLLANSAPIYMVPVLAEVWLPPCRQSLTGLCLQRCVTWELHEPPLRAPPSSRGPAGSGGPSAGRGRCSQQLPTREQLPSSGGSW